MNTNKAVCFWMPVAMMNEARELSRYMGIPLSKWARTGFQEQIKKWQAVRVLTEKDNENAK